MEKIIDNNVHYDAMRMALKVEFLANSEELFLYVGALYAAMMWGRGIDEKSKATDVPGE
ncbi:hypothetical protein AAE250_20690 [Bacteroides sp. GD17]|jgi:hypothetical protein|uniref:hypothetical protein n=1 Tax=Bacteroides sp. GD17 TaxID=3139826 RepID=UPI0025D446CC|nr:hypothetical protein [uncultured Bacteroides sp.]